MIPGFPAPNPCRDRCCAPSPSPDGWLGSLMTLAVLGFFFAFQMIFAGA